MKIIQILLQVVTVLLIAVLLYFYISNKEEIARLGEAKENVAAKVGVEGNTFAQNINKAVAQINELEQDLNASEVTNQGLNNQLASTRDELNSRTNELRQARQEARLANNEVATVKERVSALQTELARAEREVESERQSRIQIQQVRLTDTQRIDELTAQLASAQLEIQSLQDGSTGRPASPTLTESSSDPADGSARIANLEQEIARLRAQVAATENNPTLDAFANLAGQSRFATSTGDAVSVSSLSVKDGLVILAPLGDFNFENRMVLNLLEDGIKVADVRLVSVLPNHLVAEILPSSPQVKALERGKALNTRRAATL
ncbi:MAG: hypothetical protein ACFCU4_08550 [Puniceicoccaceae bacterium]